MSQDTQIQTGELNDQDLDAVGGGTSVQGPYQLCPSGDYCPRFIDIHSSI